MFKAKKTRPDKLLPHFEFTAEKFWKELMFYIYL